MKKIMAILLALTSLTGLCSCTKEPEREQSLYEEIEETNEQEEKESNNEPELETAPPDRDFPEEKEERSYASETLSIRGITDQYKNEFVALLNRTGDDILLAGNKVKDYSYDSDSWISEKTDVQRIVPLADGYGYMDSKNMFHVYENGCEFVCADIIGEVFHEFYSSFSGTLVVFSKDSAGYLYINGFRSSGAKETYDNDKLYIKDILTEKYYDRVDEIDVATSGSSYFYARVGDVHLYDTLSSVYKFDNKVQIWASRDLSRAHKIYAYGYNHSFTSPLYSATGELFRLFYENGWDSDEIPVDLPDGYTTEDIQEVEFGDIIVVMFKDGSVYSATLTHSIHGIDLAENAELSEYGRQGKIKDIFLSTYRANNGASIIVLMDDNVQYEVVEAEAEE